MNNLELMIYIVYFLFLLGCNPATTRFTRRSASMSELTNNCETSLFAPVSNEHTFFAGTLRNWSDSALQRHGATSVPLCSRCVGCRCESLKDLPNSLVSPNHHNHHHRHDPSCPNFRQHERAKTSSRQRLINKPKRRANSCDPVIPSNSHTSLTKPKNRQSPSPSPITPPTKRKQSISKIPIRIPSSTVTTTASEHSPSSSSITENQSFNRPTKIPRPISSQNISSPTKPILSSSNEDLDQDR